MQLVNTPDLNAISPAWLSALTGPVSKNDLDTVISVADKPMHPEMTAISELAGDFGLLAETTLALIGSDQKRQPEIDEKEASDLARLKHLKADTERALKGGAADFDLSEGAMELKLTMLSLELSEIIDKLLKGRMQSQKDRNVQIETLNDLLSELRKMEKSTDTFDASTLNKPDKTVPPGSPMQKRSIERMRAEMEKGKADAAAKAQTICDKELKDARVSPEFERQYQRCLHGGYTAGADISADGNLRILAADGGAYPYINIKIPFASSRKKIREAFSARQNSINVCKEKFNTYMAGSRKVSLNVMLLEYGVYKDGEKLPTTKEDLEAATEKISSMVNSINSTQSLKMLDIHKFTNGRNEAYDLAVKVNNTKFDSLNALIKMIGER